MDFKYQGRRGKYKVAAGMQMLVTHSMRNKHMLNMQQCTIDKISENYDGNLKFTGDNKILSHSEFRESFMPACCVTVYKYIGGTINKDYNIYDVEKVDKKQFYTALFRTTKIERIH